MLQWEKQLMIFKPWHDNCMDATPSTEYLNNDYIFFSLFFPLFNFLVDFFRRLFFHFIFPKCWCIYLNSHRKYFILIFKCCQKYLPFLLICQLNKKWILHGVCSSYRNSIKETPILLISSWVIHNIIYQNWKTTAYWKCTCGNI